MTITLSLALLGLGTFVALSLFGLVVAGGIGLIRLMRGAMAMLTQPLMPAPQPVYARARRRASEQPIQRVWDDGHGKIIDL
ncbi:hypothetical protein [Pseudohoeflea coraliihabitans]|uniref:Uncharacterized protein n=1 Tax=Pseudohoeflea coraliihabitans TaxID=2860393 RepID=A0ABS6WU59_9HYPH|nr:hypothetical protein [Pseudohoeflea sp. DP4N28-3]MBW3099168.1 hypothetical protein [Pseudohoeflea sp. DP4N28-3]